MHQIKRVAALVFALIMLTGAVASAKEFVVGTNPEFPPFEFVGDSGEIEGIDPEIITAIIQKIDAANSVRIEAMEFDALIPALASGKIDVAIAGMSVSEDRKKSVDFTDPYFDAVQAVIVKEGSEIAGEADLEGKKIGVQMGTTGDLYVTDNIKDADVQRFSKGIDAVQDVINGRLDAVVIDAAPAAVFVSQGNGLTLLSEQLNSGNEQYAIALPKGSEFVGPFNEALAALKADGTLDAIIAKYQG